MEVTLWHFGLNASSVSLKAECENVNRMNRLNLSEGSTKALWIVVF